MIKVTALILSLCLVFASSMHVAAGEQNPTEPESTESIVSETQYTESEATTWTLPVASPAETEAMEPHVTEPISTEAEATEPMTTETEATESAVSEPEATEPEATEPEVSEPRMTTEEVTEPTVASSDAAEPETAVSEPAAAEADQAETSPLKQDNLAAGTTRSIWLRSNGTVASVGGTDSKTGEWRDIRKISAYGHAVGLRNNGTVIAEKGILGEKNIRNWVSIVDIDTSENNTIALTENGTVVVAGYNTYGQCNTSTWT